MKQAIIAVALATVLLAIPAKANDLQAGADEVVKAIQKHMLYTYVCSNHIGNSQYQMARTIAESTLREFGIDPDAAILQVAQYEQWVEEAVAREPEDWPFGTSDALYSMNTCYEQTSDSLFDLREASARMRQAFDQ